MRAGVPARLRRAVEPGDEVTLSTAPAAIRRGLDVHFELLSDDLRSTPHRVRFTVTVDPDIFWPLYGELHPETVRESEAWGRDRRRAR